MNRYPKIYQGGHLVEDFSSYYDPGRIATHRSARGDIWWESSLVNMTQGGYPPIDVSWREHLVEDKICEGGGYHQ